MVYIIAVNVSRVNLEYILDICGFMLLGQMGEDDGRMGFSNIEYGTDYDGSGV